MALVWSLYLLKDTNAVEKVQVRYTKIVCRRCNISFKSYDDRLIKLNLLSLQNRKIRTDLVTLFKIVNNISDLKFSSYFILQSSPFNLRSSRTKILPKKRFTSSAWNGSFFERAPRYWNRLSDDITSLRSLDSFKLKLGSICYVDLLRNY